MVLRNESFGGGLNLTKSDRMKSSGSGGAIDVQKNDFKADGESMRDSYDYNWNIWRPLIPKMAS